MNNKFFSLFDGIGCFPLAYCRANNIDHETFDYHSSEIMDFLTTVLDNNFKNHIQLGDAEGIDPSSMDVDVITMGTPCTGFSIGSSGHGERTGLKHAESRLFETGIDVINKLRPKYFIWENVYGVFSTNKGNEYKEILNHFKSIGYDVTWSTLDSKYFGVPQRRRRVYVIGSRDGLNLNENIFDFKSRSTDTCKGLVKEYQQNLKWDFSKGDKVEDYFSYFTRQRSDEFSEIGLASTIMKRDYKDFTDLVVKDGIVRRVEPRERLALQGMPLNWFDNTEKFSKLHQYKANGMTLPVVEYVFEHLNTISAPTFGSTNDDFSKQMVTQY